MSESELIAVIFQVVIVISGFSGFCIGFSSGSKYQKDLALPDDKKE